MILWLTCTHGRFRCLQRNLQCFLDQDYDDECVMFICNSGKPLKLPDDLVLPDNKKIYVDNCGHMGFTSVGEKYNHALKLALGLYPQIGIVTSADDDDLFLPNHITEGVRGMLGAVRNYQMAYKPQRSYFRYRDEQGNIKISLQENTLEPSIFVHRSWIENYGYAEVSVKYHQQWLDPLVEQRAIDIVPHGTPTLIYNWGDNGGPDSYEVFKMSGAGHDTQRNFNAHLQASQDMGNGILTPSGDNSKYYEEINGIS